MRLRKLNQTQRTVVVIGLAAVLYFIGRWIMTIGGSFGWVAYAPLSNGVNGGSFLVRHTWAQLLIWLGLTLVWIFCSVVLYAGKSDD